MIRLGLIVVAVLLPSALLAGLILAIFPHISQVMLIVVTTLIIGLLLFWYRKNKLKNLEEVRESGEFIEKRWFEKPWIFIGFLLCSVLGSSIMHGFNKVTIYLDNGSEKEIVVTINNKEKITVAAKKHQEVEVVAGSIDITYHNQTKKYTVDNTGKWILNIDTQNVYMAMPITYSSNTTLYKDGKMMESENERDYKIVKDEFFNTKADFLFEAPTTISIRKRRFESAKDVSKLVLYRYNKKEMANSEEEEEEDESAADEVNTSKTVKDKAKKRAN
jgi:hypothetical protein